MKFSQKQWILLLISGVIGGLIGYAYYYFIGCNSGHCPITSNWKLTTLYGLVGGLIIGFPSKKKSNKEDNNNNKEIN